MKRDAFSIVEIVIALFLIFFITAIFVPMNISNVSQAERVAKWKNVFEESRYSFELLKAQNQSVIMDSKNNRLSDDEAFDRMKPYLNVCHEKSTKEYFKDYKYKFLNGKKVNPQSLFYVNDFATLESGVIIGFKLYQIRHTYRNTPVAMMLFDVNGLDKPNRIGKDIFGINIFENAIKPFGDGQSSPYLKANCSPIGTGTFCSKYYLIGGNF